MFYIDMTLFPPNSVPTLSASWLVLWLFSISMRFYLDIHCLYLSSSWINFLHWKVGSFLFPKRRGNLWNFLVLSIIRKPEYFPWPKWWGDRVLLGRFLEAFWHGSSWVERAPYQVKFIWWGRVALSIRSSSFFCHLTYAFGWLMCHSFSSYEDSLGGSGPSTLVEKIDPGWWL